MLNDRCVLSGLVRKGLQTAKQVMFSLEEKQLSAAKHLKVLPTPSTPSAPCQRLETVPGMDAEQMRPKKMTKNEQTPFISF